MTEINETPRRTSKNYGINAFPVPDGTFDGDAGKRYIWHGAENLRGVTVTGGGPVSVRVPLSEETAAQTRQAGLVMNIVIDRSQRDPVRINIRPKGRIVSAIHVTVCEGVSVRMVIAFLSDARDVFHNGTIKFSLGKGCDADIIVVHDLGEGNCNYVSYENILEDNAHLEYRIIDFAGMRSVHGYNAYLEGTDTFSDLKTMYVGGRDAQIDLNFSQNVTGERSNANMDTVGALTHNARKSFKGTVDFRKGCRKSVGYESELCLLLGNGARSKQLPMMLCTEEEVEGSHSTAVGKIEGDALFYIMSRGLTKTEAMKLLTRAKFSLILSGLFDRKLAQDIMDKTDGKLYEDE